MDIEILWQSLLQFSICSWIFFLYGGRKLLLLSVEMIILAESKKKGLANPNFEESLSVLVYLASELREDQQQTQSCIAQVTI